MSLASLGGQPEDENIARIASLKEGGGEERGGLSMLGAKCHIWCHLMEHAEIQLVGRESIAVSVCVLLSTESQTNRFV